MGFLNNRIVQILLAVLFVVGICMLTKLNLHGSVGSNGVDFGAERIPK